MPYARLDHEQQSKGGYRAFSRTLGVVISERIIHFGILTTFLGYLKEFYHHEQQLSTHIVGLWSGLNGVFLFGGAFVSDKYLGRHGTIVLSSLSLTMGTVILTIITIISTFPYLCSQKYLEAGNQCTTPARLQVEYVYLSLLLVSMGTGGIVPCSTPFMADQLNCATVKSKALSTFFKWFHFGKTMAMAVGLSVITSVQLNGSWSIGFMIYSSCIVISSLLFVIAGRKTYIHEKAQERLTDFQKEERKMFLQKIIPIWLTAICPLTTIFQQITFTYFRAIKLDLYVIADFKMRATWLFPISMIAVGILLVIIDSVLVPSFKWITGYQSKKTMLQGIGIGIACSVASMVVGGVVEEFALSHSDTVMSVFYLLPQLLLLGISMVYFIGGLLELFNRECPQHLTNFANAVFSSSFEIATCVNDYVFMSLQWITKNEERPNWLYYDSDDGRLKYCYYFLAGLGLLNFLGFLLYATKYQYKDNEDVGGTGGEVAMLGRQEPN